MENSKMNKKEILELMLKIFDVLTSYDLSSLKGEDPDYIMTSIYYKIYDELCNNFSDYHN